MIHQTETDLDTLVPLSVARRTLIPRRASGKLVSPSTIWRL